MGRLFVREIGSGERVIFVHGALTDGSLTWSRQAPLAERYRLLVVDRRGYGKSPESTGDDWDVDSADIVELLDENAHLVTHSFGGFGSMIAAAARPEQVLSLTLVEPPMVGLVANHPDAIAVNEYVERARVEALGWAEDSEELEEWLVMFLAQAGIDTSRIKRPLSSEIVHAGRVMIHGRPPMTFVPPLDEVDAAPFPKLVVTGNHRAYYEAIGDVLETRLHAQRVVLEGRGHAIPLLGEPFNEVLDGFLESASHARSASMNA